MSYNNSKEVDLLLCITLFNMNGMFNTIFNLCSTTIEEEMFMKIRKILSLLLSMVLILPVVTGCDSKKADYDKAVALFNDESYEEALAIFDGLGTYEDSQSYATDCMEKQIMGMWLFETNEDEHAGFAFAFQANYKLDFALIIYGKMLGSQTNLGTYKVDGHKVSVNYANSKDKDLVGAFSKDENDGPFSIEINNGAVTLKLGDIVGQKLQ